MADNPRNAACEPPGRTTGRFLHDSDLEPTAAMLKALAHPVRLRMTGLIHAGGGDLCVCEIESEFELTQPTITHHLKVLREAGLVRSRKEGQWVRHAIETQSIERLRDMLDTLVRETA